MKGIYFVYGLIALVIVFFVVDCSCGTTRYFECQVASHRYKPAWTEVTTATDDDGNTQTSITHHPEEWHVVCREYGSQRELDCQETHDSYDAHADGQDVTVKARVGRWTGGAYMPHITN